MEDDVALKAPSDGQSGPKIAKEAPSESSEAIWTRRLIIFAFWAVVVFLGLPQWLWTTTIRRASLPLDDMNDWAEGKVRIS